jgi:vacuolar protein sorting-associated protein 54
LFDTKVALRTHDIRSSPDTSLLQDDFSDILGSAAEFVHTQVARVITSRTEQHAALELPQFLIIFHDSWDFVIKCETLCRRMIVGLRGVVVSQVLRLMGLPRRD